MSNNNSKPCYKLSDFEKKIDYRSYYKCECPVCGKMNLYISKEKKLFNCFSSVCDFKGKLKDENYYEGNNNATGSSLSVSKSSKNGYGSGKKDRNFDDDDDDAFIPDDYVNIMPYLSATFVPLDANKSEFPLVTAIWQYLDEQKIKREVAIELGCMATMQRFYVDDDKDKAKGYGMDNNRKFDPKPCIAYVNKVNGNVVNVKYRAVGEKCFNQDGQKRAKGSAANIPSAPYNIECINPLCNDVTDTLVITEGEKDVLTVIGVTGMHQVISIPNGSNKNVAEYMDVFAEWLKPIRKVIICGDMDRAGRVMKRAMTKYFTNKGVQVAVLDMSIGCKDISEVNQRYGEDEVKRLFSEVTWQHNPNVMRISDNRSMVMRVLNGEYDHGYDIGYGSITDKHFRLTSTGGLIVVTGRPNSGKTDWMRCTLTKLMLQKNKHVAMLSFEEPNKEMQIKHIVELAFGDRHTECIPDEQKLEFLDRLDALHVNLRTKTIAPTPSQIIKLCDRLIDSESFNMDFLYIDPYLFIENEMPKESETQQIKSVLTTFQEWGRERNIWVIIVAHPRKLVKDGNGEYEEVDEYSISGSAHWANLADYLLSVKRVFPGGNENDGSASPSYTEVDVLKVRDQTICHTGKLFFLRQANGRYEERADKNACISDLAAMNGF